jgi:hypothetical protein
MRQKERILATKSGIVPYKEMGFKVDSCIVITAVTHLTMLHKFGFPCTVF